MVEGDLGCVWVGDDVTREVDVLALLHCPRREAPAHGQPDQGGVCKGRGRGGGSCEASGDFFEKVRNDFFVHNFIDIENYSLGVPCILTVYDEPCMRRSRVLGVPRVGGTTGQCRPVFRGGRTPPRHAGHIPQAPHTLGEGRGVGLGRSVHMGGLGAANPPKTKLVGKFRLT